MIETHRLMVFRAVVAAGSVNGAATSLGYTPSAISQQLAALQRETGLVLVERRGRGIVATAAGRRLADEAGSALERLAGLEAVIGDLRAGRIGSLTISYISSAGTAWMPAVVAALATEFPSLRLDLRLVELTEIGNEPDLEISVRGADSTAGAEDYRRHLLLDEPYLAVVSAGHRFAHRSEVSLVELRDEAWVDNDVARGPCRQVVLDACATLGFDPVFRIQAQDYRSALDFVGAGVGITVLPVLGTVDLPAGLIRVPVIDPTPRRQVELAVRTALGDHPAVVRAVDLIRRQVVETTPRLPADSTVGLDLIAI